MAGVYQLCHVFEFVIYCLYYRSFAQLYLIIKRYQLVLHIALQTRYQVDAVIEKTIEQFLRDIPLISKQLSEYIVTQTVKYILVSIINIGLCKHEIEQLASFVAYEVKLKTKVPPHGALEPLNTLFLVMRLLWHTGTHVLSTKLMPVHLPKQNNCRNSIISKHTRDSNSTKRLYES